MERYRIFFCLSLVIMLASIAALMGPEPSGLASNRDNQGIGDSKKQSDILCRGNPSPKHVASFSLVSYWLLGRADVGSLGLWLENSIGSFISGSGTVRNRANAAPGPAAQTVDISVGPNGQNIFGPDPVIINVGDTVRWTFASVGHDVVSGSSCIPDNRFCWPNNTNCGNNGNGNVGTTYSQTFNTAGSFPYFCSPHCSSGMTGTILVQASPTPTPTPTPSQIVDVSVGPGGANSFSPDTVVVNVGDTVRWTFASSGHNVVSGSNCLPDNRFCSPSDVNCGNSPNSSSGAVYTHVFNSAGMFPYYCKPHCTEGMTGTVIVQAGPTPTPTPTPTPASTIQFNQSAYTVAEDGGFATIDVARAGSTSSAASVDYATSDGTALQRRHYTFSAGTLNFAAGETSKSFVVPIVDDMYVEANRTVNLTLSNPVGANLGAQTTALLTINEDDTIEPTSKRAVAKLNSGQETPPNTSTARGLSTVTLSADETTATVSLNFTGLSSTQTGAHIHGPALATVPASILFPLQTGPLTNFPISPTAAQVQQLKAGLHYANVHTSNFQGGEIRGQLLFNPLDDVRSFVQLHYYDFLGRYPDQAGWNFWMGQITSCLADQGCIEIKRINVSGSFYLSIEFQETGYLVERMYKAAYGDATGTSQIGGTHQLSVPIVRYAEFLFDSQRIRQGVVVGQPGWEMVLESNKQAFAAAFVQRSRFATAFPTNMTPAQFVDKLFMNAGVTPSTADRNAVISEFGSATDTSDLAARGRALRRVAENSTFTQQEFNRAFVLMQYFGYLRRNPEDPPDLFLDDSGFEFWLNKLNFFNGNFINAEMVKAFITSIEYRQRFGP